MGLVKRFKELGLKVADGYKPIEELAGLKLIIPVTIDGNRLYEITQSGKKKLGRKVTHQGRGGLEHRYFVEKIKAHYLDNEGFTYLEKDETGKSDVQGNLIKLGRSNAEHKVVVTTNKETEIKINALIKELCIPDKENIRTWYVKDFLKNPPSL